MNDMYREPAMTVAFRTVIGTFVGLLIVQFGLPLDAAFQEALVTCIVCLGIVVNGWLIRQKVLSPQTGERLMADTMDLQAEVYEAFDQGVTSGMRMERVEDIGPSITRSAPRSPSEAAPFA